MNVWLGDAAITVALAASIVVAAVAAQGIARRSGATVALAIRLSWVVLAAAVAAFAVLERALITRDFSVAYVAKNGSTLTPPLYNFATAWASLEGSILLWGLVLAGYLVAVAHKFRRQSDDPIVGWAVLVLAVVSGFFFLLLFGPADPFTAVSPVPSDGPGPNPLLQNNLLMAFHPPVLYLGYVGFTVPFAFAIGALATGRFDEGWLVATRRWSLFAWGFLTVGIILGAWWAYDVLGWGGYWGWDPVENASLLPWLTATAYIHSVLVQERRGILRVWNLSLVCATFALTILGTFITRSGVLRSVHAFSESSIGPWLIAFLGIVIVVTVGLIGWRAEALRSPGGIDNPLSREASFLMNNLVFAVFAFVVLLGTIFPLAAEAYDGRRLSVGTPYFDRMTAPLGLTLLFLMAVAPVLPWRKTTVTTLADRLRWPVWVGVGAIVTAVALGGRGFLPLLAFFLAGFAAGSALRQVVLATRRNGWRGLIGRANGGMIVHLGVIAIAVGIAGSSAYLRQAELAFDEGETLVFADSTFTFQAMETTQHPNRREIAAVISVDGSEMRPALEQYLATGQQVGSPATRSSMVRDLQLSITQQPDDPGDPVVLKITSQPLIAWLWLGGLIMAVGTVLSAFPTRYSRRPTDPVSAPAGAVAPSDSPDAAGAASPNPASATLARGDGEPAEPKSADTESADTSLSSGANR